MTTYELRKQKDRRKLIDSMRLERCWVLSGQFFAENPRDSDKRFTLTELELWLECEDPPQFRRSPDLAKAFALDSAGGIIVSVDWSARFKKCSESHPTIDDITDTWNSVLEFYKDLS